MVINWDHIGIHYVPVSNWTMAIEGLKRVEIFGIEDKRQITAVFAGTMAGDFLYPQIVYMCMCTLEKPCNVCLQSSFQAVVYYHTENHWANEKTTEDYIQLILLPYMYIASKRSELSLELTHPALVIFDRFKSQCTEKILKMLDDNNIHIAVVPAHCTDRLQPQGSR